MGPPAAAAPGPVGKATGVVNPSAAVDQSRLHAILTVDAIDPVDQMNQMDTIDPDWPPRERAEGLVVGMLGHELRNPLSAIVALARVTMSRDDLPGDVRERLAQMDRAAQRSLAMITSLLDYSESRWRGSLPTRPVPAEPGVIASRVIDELRVANPDRVIVLDLRSPLPFELDPARMEQVLSNLIGNAIVHGAHDAPIEVAIDVCETEALLSVKNRGPAIPPEQIASLFKPFTQGAVVRPLQGPVPGGERERPRGLGLGLFIVQEIVDAHGGTISVDSDGERGTTFLVRLPRRLR
jgi:signal transduction histidine kinase